MEVKKFKNYIREFVEDEDDKSDNLIDVKMEELAELIKSVSSEKIMYEWKNDDNHKLHINFIYDEDEEPISFEFDIDNLNLTKIEGDEVSYSEPVNDTEEGLDIIEQDIYMILGVHESQVLNFRKYSILEKNIPTDKKLWQKALRWVKGTKHGGSATVRVDGEVYEAPNDGKVYEEYPSAYCVPKDNSEALTKEGWKKYSDLSVGDEIAAYDYLNDEIRFTEVLNLHSFNNQEIYNFYSIGKNYSYECTKNHKVVFSYLKDYDLESITEKFNIIQKVFNRELTYNEARSKIADPQGNVERYGGESFDYYIQNSKNNIPKLREVKDIPIKNGSVIVSSKLVKNDNIKINNYIKYETDPVKMVLNMNHDQMLSFLNGCIMCDGWQSNNNKRTKSYSYGFRQKNKENLEAVKIAAFLTGHIVYEGNKDLPSGCKDIIISNVRHIGCSSTELKKTNCKKDVWCPETKYGTWIMKQVNTMTITGNSNSYAAKMYKKRSGNCKK